MMEGRQLLGTILVIAATLAVPAAAFGQDPAYQDALDRIIEAKDAGRLAEAISILDAEWDEVEGTEAQRHLMKATFLNGLMRFDEAYASATRAIEAVEAEEGHVSAALVTGDAHMERGYALYKQEQYDEAIAELDRAIEAGPTEDGADQAMVLRGAAKARAGRYEEAKQDFEEGLSRMQEDDQLYGSAQEWREHLARRGQAAGTEERYGVKFGFNAGHSSNALRYNVSDAQLPGGVSSKSSFFYDGNLYAWADPYLSEDGNTRLRLSTNPRIRWYDSAQSFSYVKNRARAELRHVFSSEFLGGVAMSYDLTWLLSPGRKFARTYEPSVFGRYRWNDEHTTTMTVSYSITDYYLSNLGGPRNPDANTTRVQLQHEWWLNDEKTLALVGTFGHTWNSAKGSDWDFTSVDAGAALFARPTEELTITGGVYAAFYDYKHPHSMASTPKPREDTILVAFVSADYALTDFLSVTAGFTHTIANSNIDVFEYEDTQPTLGFQLSW